VFFFFFFKNQKTSIGKRLIIIKNKPLQRLAKEAYIWARLKHKNVLPLLGFFVDDENQFPHLVSEWVVRGNLSDYLKTLDHGVEMTTMVHRMIPSIVGISNDFHLTFFF